MQQFLSALENETEMTMYVDINGISIVSVPTVILNEDYTRYDDMFVFDSNIGEIQLPANWLSFDVKDEGIGICYKFIYESSEITFYEAR